MRNSYKAEENRQKFKMELMRLQTAHIVAPHIKDKITDLSKFMPFEWDPKPELYIPSEQDWEHFDKLVQKWQVKQ